MSEQVNEMNLPVISLPVMGTQGMDDNQPAADSSITVGTPGQVHSPACVSVYAESIAACGAYDPTCGVATFDIVFNVGVLEGNTSKTYRVVKRIAIDKCKIACEAECAPPISVVETKAEEKKAETAAAVKRFKILAGLE